MKAENFRWNEIIRMWHDYPILFMVVGFIAGLLSYPAFQLIVHDLGELLSNLVPEVFGIGITVFFIDKLYSIRDEKWREKELQSRLLLEAGSQSNETSKRAIDELYKRNWLHLISGQNLRGANLQDAKLWHLDFSGCDLAHAHLEKAILVRQSQSDESLIHMAKFDDNTILPDGTHFIPELGLAQMERFGCIVGIRNV
jgi:hypothetical protein